MRSSRAIYVLVLLAALLAPCLTCNAQFKREAFSQQYNDDNPNQLDTTQQVFNLKKYIGGLTHKREADVTTMFEGSVLVVGGMQIYNRDYWKLPIIYTGIAAGVTGGILYGKAGNTKASTLCYVGAGLMYWGALLDGTINYRPQPYPSPGIPPLYSLLVPGLGQIYNHELWKLPVYWGGMIASAHYYFEYKQYFERFRSIYNDATNPEVHYDGPISAESALYYKNLYRRYRDYAVLAFFGVYLLQAIDANVFAYMHNFEVTEDLTMDISPAIIAPANQYAFSGSQAPALGLGLRFTF